MKLKSTEILKALEVLLCLNAQVRPAKASHLQLLGLALLCSSPWSLPGTSPSWGFLWFRGFLLLSWASRQNLVSHDFAYSWYFRDCNLGPYFKFWVYIFESIYIYIFLVYYKYLINIYVHRTNSVCLPAVFFLSYVEIKLGRYSRVVALACKPSGHGWDRIIILRLAQAI